MCRHAATANLARHVWGLLHPLLHEQLPAHSIALARMPNIAVMTKYYAGRNPSKGDFVLY